MSRAGGWRGQAGVLLLALLAAVAPAFGAETAAVPGGGLNLLATAPAPSRTTVQVERSDHRYLDETLTEDTTWQGTVLVEGWLTVASQATLTIQPGTIIRFKGGGLLVKGRLQAFGSQGKPVIFTSPYSEPLPGDWQGIVLLSSEKKNILEQCRVEGAETGLEASYATLTLNATHFVSCRTGLRLQDALATVAGGGALGCDSGFVVDDSELDLRETVLAGNRTGLAAAGSSLTASGCQAIDNQGVAVSADNCRLRLQRNLVARNGTGMKLVQSEGTVSGSRLLDNRDFGLTLSRARVKVTGNEIAGNRVGLQADDRKALVWGNAFLRSGAHQLVYAGNDDFRLGGNWWGVASPGEAGKGILDGRSEKGRGRVAIEPLLPANPLAGW